MPAYTNESGDSGGRRQVIVALVLLFAAVSVAFLPSPRQQQVAWAIRESALRPFILVQEGFSVARFRATDAGVLRRQLDSLVATTSGHFALAAENRRLHALVGLGERIGPGWVSANVVRPGTAGSESTFMLNVGSEHGVERNAPVIAGQGVVGVVREVHARTSIAMDWTHPEFAVSAMDQQGTVYGIVRTRRGRFREEDRLEFDGTAYQTRVEDGTPIVTSNLSGIWPPGVPIGKVVGLAEADAGWRKSYWLRPMVDVASLRHVMVAVGPDRDVFGVWAVDSIFTDSELALHVEAREDSLRALADSVQMLRILLAAPRPLRDSLLASLLIDDPDALPGLWSTERVEPAAGTTGSGTPGTAGTAPANRAGAPASGAGQSQTAPATDPQRPPAADPQRPPATEPQRPPAAEPRIPPPAEPRRPVPAGGAVPGNPIPPFPRPTDTIQARPPAGGRANPPPPDTLLSASTGAIRVDSGGTTIERRSGEEVRIREGGASRR
jgi:cell shape-determining protein MreC